MGIKKKDSKPMFPDAQWWKDPPASEDADDGAGGDAHLIDVNGNADYGSTQSRDEEGGGPSFPIAGPADDDSGELVDHRLDHSYELNVPSDSDVTDRSSSGESCDYEEGEEIEPPHRTLGLIFFDFLRFVTIGVNVRSINTQIIPVFSAWGRMELLHVALRIFMTLMSVMLILVEFPHLFPFLRHAPDDASSPPPPLYIVNWIPRGVFYAFLGTVCFEQSIVVRALDSVRGASTSSRFFDSIFIVVSAWCLLALGAAYIALGLLCIQGVMERVRRDEREKWREYREKVRELELEREEEEEREWLLENGGEGAWEGDDAGRWGWWRRWRRRCKRRRSRGGGLFYWLGCRAVDCRC